MAKRAKRRNRRRRLPEARFPPGGNWYAQVDPDSGAILTPQNAAGRPIHHRDGRVYAVEYNKHGKPAGMRRVDRGAKVCLR